jgi:hypothetical protein
LKIEYTIGRDTPPIIYAEYYGDYTIKTELSGTIAIQIQPPFGDEHNGELLMSKNQVEIKQKLYQVYDPALVALTAKPEMVYESGRVKIKAPIATSANLGPYAIGVNSVSPLHMSGTVNPQTISGTLEIGRRNYDYSADIEFKVDVIWNPGNKVGPKPVEVTVNHPQEALQYEDQTSDEKTGIIATVVLIFVGIIASLCTFGQAGSTGIPQTTSIMPFTHTINDRKQKQMY